MPNVIDMTARRVLTDEDFDQRLEAIEARFAELEEEKNAYRDQELARLFYRSGWTQERLAKKVELSQNRISERLTFGRFLQFIAARDKSQKPPKNLTEWKFRGYYAATDKKAKEKIRFRETWKALEVNLRIGKSTVKKPEIARKILERFGDGEWVSPEEIAETIEESPENVGSVLKGMHYNGSYQSHCETRKYGSGVQYRVMKSTGKKIDLDLLLKELQPILKGLRAEGLKNAATASPPAVAHLTHQLIKIIEALAK